MYGPEGPTRETARTSALGTRGIWNCVQCCIASSFSMASAIRSLATSCAPLSRLEAQQSPVDPEVLLSRGIQTRGDGA